MPSPDPVGVNVSPDGCACTEESREKGDTAEKQEPEPGGLIPPGEKTSIVVTCNAKYALVSFLGHPWCSYVKTFMPATDRTESQRPALVQSLLHRMGSTLTFSRQPDSVFTEKTGLVPI